MTREAAALAELYDKALLDDVLPFWAKHSIDRECGGYFTCLDRAGSVFDTDKFVWLQAREVWTFSMLYNRLAKNDGWLDIARHGAEFLRQHGRDAAGDWYFALDRGGSPLVQPYNIFSDCFAAMAFSQYALAAQDDEAKDLALRTFHRILERQEDPKGRYSKVVPGTRPLRSLALPMILANLAVELESLLDGATLQQREWDQKLWWVHCEALVALLMAYALSGREECWDWYQRVHDYAWRHFPDPEHGEWFGYLDRRGQPLLTLKGGKWKGCFHLPRTLFLCASLLRRIAAPPEA